MIRKIQENESFKYGCNKLIMEVEDRYKLKNTTWNDEVANQMKIRKISVANGIEHHKINTTNKTIMDYAV